MKKLTLLVAIAAFATSCNSKPGVNHGVIELEHETATAEEMHHKAEAAHGAHEKHEATEEENVETKVGNDSVKVATETPKVEKKDTVKAGH